MKTTTTKISMMILLALASIFICALFVSQNSYAFADEGKDEGNQFSEAYTSQTSNDDGNWWGEDDAVKDFENSIHAEDGISKANPESNGQTFHSDIDTYHVITGMNRITRNINGTEFSFVYDLRGYLGDWDGGYYRNPNVQYFYNTHTKEIVFLTFGNGEIGFKTFKNKTTSDTVFEDKIHYDTDGDDFRYSIAENVEKCYLDPKITGLGQYVFQCCINLKEVDIINQKYENVNMEIADNAFRKVNIVNGCEVKFFNAFDSNKHFELFTSFKRWAEQATIIYEGKKYCLENWEEVAEIDRRNSTFAEDGVGIPNAESEGIDNFLLNTHTYYVINHFNTIKRNIVGKEYSFKYNLRGYIGEPDGSERTPNVQFFYNTHTKEMVFLTFGNGEVGFGTYRYHGTFDTIFEDKISYKIDDDNEFEYDIAENAEKCYLDPKIQELGGHTFQCWEKLQLVDMINQEYSHVNMNICDCAFSKVNIVNGCEVKFFNGFDNNKRIELLLNSLKRWAEQATIIYEGKKYSTEKWDEIAELDRRNSTFAEDGVGTANAESEGKKGGKKTHTYYVIKHFNTIKRNIEGKEFSFTYNLRGFIGDQNNQWGRKPNVQFFYNTQTKEMVFLTFGSGDVDFRTYTYHGTFDTIFEDNISYKIDDDNEFEYDIAENAEKCYLDPKITGLGQYTFQCWEKLQFVDFINQEYSHVHFTTDKIICDCVFRKTNRDNGCDMRFLNAFDTATRYRLLSDFERPRWAGYCPVIFNGHKYTPLD